jgi:hypothetical protein
MAKAKKKTAPKKPATKKAVAKKPAPKKPVAKKPAPKPPAAKKPAPKPPAVKPAAKKPAAPAPAKTAPPARKLDLEGIGDFFWMQIEDAWGGTTPEANAQRAALATRDPEEDEADASLVDDALDGVLDRLRTAYEALPREELAQMDAFLEHRLYDIDRADIQEVTDGSDDGFLYARGYVVALGKQFYDAVNANPQMAIMDAECEEMCYLPAHIYEERFGSWPKSTSKISRESGSNPKGWPDAD